MRKVLFILGVLNDEDVDWMADAGRVLRPTPGEQVIRQGTPTLDLFFVLDGHAVAEIAGVGQVARLGSGEIVGEMSFIDKAPPSATIRAEEDCVLLAIDKRDIDARLRADMGFAARFYRALAMFLSDRLRAMSNITSGALDLDELDENVMDNLSAAGLRFDTMVRKVLRVA